MFTFVSVIREKFEYNLIILANFRVKTKKSIDFACTFSKSNSFFGWGFLKKDYIFYTKNLFFTTKDALSIVKNQLFSNMFTYLSVIRRNFEYNLRIFANFPVKTKTPTDFAHMFSKKLVFFWIFNKDCTFYTKNLVFAQSIVKIRFLVTFFTFLSVIRQNFEYNLRILSNFCVKTQKSMISNVHFQKTSFFFF